MSDVCVLFWFIWLCIVGASLYATVNVIVDKVVDELLAISECGSDNFGEPGPQTKWGDRLMVADLLK